MKPLTVLVTGVTGYVGRQLVPCLLESGYVVRCFLRDPRAVQDQPWIDQVELHRGDAHDYESVSKAMDAMDACFYLIQSLGVGRKYFAEHDRRAATNFGKAAREQGLQRLLYLGLSRRAGRHQTEHVISRIETGLHLRRWNVPVTEFRASLLIGPGSPALTLVQHVAERFPLLPCPTWMQTRAQPIATEDVLDYLVEALEVEESAGEIIDIGGPDVMSLMEVMGRYTQLRGLRRSFLPLPFAAPHVSAYVLSALTPLSIARALFLIEGLRSPSAIDDEKAQRLFSIQPMSLEASLRHALGRTDTTRFSRPETVIAAD